MPHTARGLPGRWPGFRRSSPVEKALLVTTLPLTLPSVPLGIVIKTGAPAPKPVRFWAYLWAADEESADDHWHRRVPSEHAV